MILRSSRMCGLDNALQPLIILNRLFERKKNKANSELVPLKTVRFPSDYKSIKHSSVYITKSCSH